MCQVEVNKIRLLERKYMVELVTQNFEINKKLYNKIKQQLREKVEQDVPIDHVGSTAIPNMIGKNIIDVLIGANSQVQFQELMGIIVKMGYFPSKNSKSEIYQFFASRQGETSSGDVHIHLVVLHTNRYNEFLQLRDYLLNNEDEAKAYANHKREIVDTKTAERKDYRAIKSEYVTKLIERAKNE